MGFYEIEDKGGATDNSDEIDDYVSSSDEDMSVTDAVSDIRSEKESNLSETGAILNRKVGKKAKEKLHKDDLEFLTKTDAICREITFVFIASLLLIVIFGLIANNSYERKKCG